MDVETLKKDLRAAEELSPRTLLRVASERLSTVRYVFVVSIEDGIPQVAQRSALEYSDAVLIGWPEMDAEDIVDPRQIDNAINFVIELEKRVEVFSDAERQNDIDTMSDTLIHISEYVALVRKEYQPEFLLPTYAEIRRYVQRQWDEEMAARGDENTEIESSDNENRDKEGSN
ncbi:hypothetical protein EJ419_07940 [Alloscardovia theropitheci]|uniref:Phosphoribosylglycinamide synthetase n=1 Tax=Alloscardovia theropitheci TaxID=2496842 RepID=A0A4R0QN74_9BIFI|nr:hypothetical protein EJ419_07940 [Alloscardovia theropitheci]